MLFSFNKYIVITQLLCIYLFSKILPGIIILISLHLINSFMKLSKKVLVLILLTSTFPFIIVILYRIIYLFMDPSTQLMISSK